MNDNSSATVIKVFQMLTERITLLEDKLDTLVSRKDNIDLLKEGIVYQERYNFDIFNLTDQIWYDQQINDFVKTITYPPSLGNCSTLMVAVYTNEQKSKHAPKNINGISSILHIKSTKDFHLYAISRTKYYYRVWDALHAIIDLYDTTQITKVFIAECPRFVTQAIQARQVKPDDCLVCNVADTLDQNDQKEFVSVLYSYFDKHDIFQGLHFNNNHDVCCEDCFEYIDTV